MSSSLSPNDVFVLRQTNVSNPSIIHSRPSQQSISASEDYYSLASSSNSSARSAEAPNAQAPSQQTITRYQTPPSRYRTPQQSRDLLPLPQQAQHAVDEEADEELQPFRKTPMRGQGKRRQSAGESSINTAAAVGAAEPLLAGGSTQPRPQPRPNSIQRKPVPNIAQTNRDSRASSTHARSSVYRDIDRQQDAPTPGMDDTPYIHFALDQLTRDEEVRGSRQYPGIAPGIDGSYPYQTPPNVQQQMQQPRPQYEPVAQEERDIVEQAQHPEEPSHLKPSRMSGHDQRTVDARSQHGHNIFVHVPVQESRQPPLNFVPGILRPLPLGIYTVLVTAYLICLIIAAAWSRSDIGLVRYGSFGDGTYFVFRYLPAILGMILLMWLLEIQKAVYRIAPFIAMASGLPRSRYAGARLPLSPRGFVLPYFGHFGAKQPIVGLFLLIAWMQLFTIPLLASSFNVYQDRNAQWSWLATQATIWTVIALYILLLAALIPLLFWLRNQLTGVKWDPKSLADIAALLERSNSLDGLGDAVPQLGYFRASHRPAEVFHAWGIADKPARSYSVVDGQLREKRYSDQDMDLEANQPQRYSKEAILPRSTTDDTFEDNEALPHSSALPWFLRPSLALLWPIVAFVLLLAFLIVSYLPSTDLAGGFAPLVPGFVNTLGFSGTNFLYSFLPTLLAMLLLLFWMDIDLAYRRLTPLESLAQEPQRNKTTHADTPGAIAERSLLCSYIADYPLLITTSALINSHLRLALISFTTLLSTAIPVLASGVFWAEFFIPTQKILIFPHLPAYYVLTAFVALHACAYAAIYPSATLRHTALGSRARSLHSFADHTALFADSKLLDDLVLRNLVSKTDLVTRLLSSPSAAPTAAAAGGGGILHPAAAASKVSLADSVRGFGRARANLAATTPVSPAAGMGAGAGRQQRFALAQHVGRDGRSWWGVDRVRA